MPHCSITAKTDGQKLCETDVVNNNVKMNFEKLCEEFHEKVGKDKTVKISILEGDTKDMTAWFTGTIRPEVWEEIVTNRTREKPKPFVKLSKGNGILYSYLGSSKSTIR